MKPDLSVIIATRDCLHLTQQCLASLERNTRGLNYEVIVVDDCSTDGTREFLEARQSTDFRISLNRTRASYATNNNRGARMARADVLCLLNNDTILHDGWWQPMLAGVAKLPNAGIVGNVQIRPKLKRYDHFGVVFSPEGAPAHFGQYFFFRPFRKGYREWSAITAACAMIRRSIFVNCGGLDEDFVNGSEDIDLCLRLRRLGYRNYVAFESIITHIKCASKGRRTHNQRNRDLLSQRWLEQIQSDEAKRDRRLHALTYLYRFGVYPWTCTRRELVMAMKNLFSLRKPEEPHGYAWYPSISVQEFNPCDPQIAPAKTPESMPAQENSEDFPLKSPFRNP